MQFACIISRSQLGSRVNVAWLFVPNRAKSSTTCVKCLFTFCTFLLHAVSQPHNPYMRKVKHWAEYKYIILEPPRKLMAISKLHTCVTTKDQSRAITMRIVYRTFPGTPSLGHILLSAAAHFKP